MSVLVIARGQEIIDRIVPLIRNGGIEATGTVVDSDAISRLDQGNLDALVIGGGVEDESRRRFTSIADGKGIPVIEGAARGKDPESYIRDDLLPLLREAASTVRGRR